MTILLAISSTRLMKPLINFFFFGAREYHLRLETDHITDTVTLVTDRSADLADRVDKFNTEHPLGGSELNLASEVVNVLDQRTQNDASTLGGLRTHGVHDIGSEVGVEARVGRHCDGW